MATFRFYIVKTYEVKIQADDIIEARAKAIGLSQTGGHADICRIYVTEGIEIGKGKNKTL